MNQHTEENTKSSHQFNMAMKFTEDFSVFKINSKGVVVIVSCGGGVFLLVDPYIH